MSDFAKTRWEREVRDRDERDHFVYLIARIGESFEVSGPVKVGISKSPLKRMQTLQTGCHDRLVLISKHAFWKRRHAEMVEKSFHAAMEPYRLNGEWFDLSVPSAVVALDKALNQFVDHFLQPNETENYFFASDYVSAPGFSVCLSGIDFEFPQ